MFAKNQIASYIFLLLYAVAMFRPVLPIVNYLVNYDYIAEQLCENKNKPILACYGKCYVAKEVQKRLPDSPIGDNSRIPKIDFEKFPVTPLDKFKCHLFDIDLVSVKAETYIEYSTQEYSFSILRPPQA